MNNYITTTCEAMPIYGPCAPCYLVYDTTKLTYSTPVQFATVEITPLATILPNGTILTTGSTTITHDVITIPLGGGGSSDITVTDVKDLTWLWSGTTLTYPTTYYYYSGFDLAPGQYYSPASTSVSSAEHRPRIYKPGDTLSIYNPSTGCTAFTPTSLSLAIEPSRLLYALPTSGNLSMDLATTVDVPRSILSLLNSQTAVQAQIGHVDVTSCRRYSTWTAPACRSSTNVCVGLRAGNVLICGNSILPEPGLLPVDSPNTSNCTATSLTYVESFLMLTCSVSDTTGVGGPGPQPLPTATLLTTLTGTPIIAGISFVSPVQGPVASDASPAQTALPVPQTSVQQLSDIVTSTSAPTAAPSTETPLPHYSSPFGAPQNTQHVNDASVHVASVTPHGAATTLSPTTFSLSSGQVSVFPLGEGGIVTISRASDAYIVGTQTLPFSGTVIVSGQRFVALSDEPGLLMVDGSDHDITNGRSATAVDGGLIAMTAFRSGSDIILGSHTIEAGRAATIDGYIVSVPTDGSGLLINGPDKTTSIALQDGQSAVVTAIPTISAVPASRYGSAYVIDGIHTLLPGEATTYAGSSVSVDALGASVYVDGTAYSLAVATVQSEPSADSPVQSEPTTSAFQPAQPAYRNVAGRAKAQGYLASCLGLMIGLLTT